MDEFVLEVQNLSVNFQAEASSVQALDDVSFSLLKGETLAIVGESGSGKSVTALSLMGLLPPTANLSSSSKINFRYSDNSLLNLSAMDPAQMESLRGASISMIFQEPMTSLNPLMRCGKQVSEQISLHTGCHEETAMERTIQLFREVKLPEPERLVKRYPHELSGGQKQRVMIAMAISCNPSLLIADEPTTALDVTVQGAILDLLKELQQHRGMAILFITHDLNLVRNFADNVLILYKGKCVESGITETVFTNPVAPYTRGLLNCRPSAEKRFNYLQTVEDVLNESGHHEREIKVVTDASFYRRIEQLTLAEPILRMSNVGIHYITRTNFFGKAIIWHNAVDGVSLDIHPGETLGLVGESGCGKTSLGKAIVGLIKPDRGEIRYKGMNVFDLSKSDQLTYHKEVQIIFQDPYSSLNPRLSIGDCIKEPMEVHGLFHPSERKDKVLELLGKVGLSEAHYARYPHEFSGGQRQRICIARALAMQPSFIVCDESVSALDVSVQAQVLNLLVSLREEFGLSYLFISHDLKVVRHVSDRVAVMQHGKVIELNDAESVYRSPAQDYTRQLIKNTL